jgi:hypothetical protein
MKKILSTIAAFTVILSASAVSAQSIGVAIGGAYPIEQESFGFSSSATFNIPINPLFAVGVEGGFDWMKKDIKADDAQAFGDFNAPSSYSENMYTFPVLVNATFIVPTGEGDEAAFNPFIRLGAGYGWALYRSDLEGADDYTFSGLAYQGVIGALINPGEAAQGMKVIVEAGYRGTDFKTDIDIAGVTKSVKLDMNSAFVRVGVSFNLGGDDF